MQFVSMESSFFYLGQCLLLLLLLNEVIGELHANSHGIDRFIVFPWQFWHMPLRLPERDGAL